MSNGIVIESKGKFTALDRKKMLAMRLLHPDIDLRLLFQYDNKLSKTSKTRYTEWADKNHIIAAVKTIPEGWLLPSKQIRGVIS